MRREAERRKRREEEKERWAEKLTYCGIIVVCRVLMFLNFVGETLINELKSPQTFNKVMNCLALICNKPVTHKT